MKLFKRKETVVIVCTANITRSPYFAGRLKHELAKLDIPSSKLPEILSAGTHAKPRVSPHPIMQTVAELRDINIKSELSNLFDESMAKKADLVLTMEISHKEHILDQFPKLAGKIFTVLEYGKEISEEMVLDIDDPTGGEMDDYKKYADLADAQAQRLRRYYKKNKKFSS